MRLPKKSLHKWTFALFFIASIIFLTHSQVSSAAGLIDNEQIMEPSTNWGALHTSTTGASGTGTYFGAYQFLADGDDLYIGFGTARAAESDGAMLVKYDGTTVTAIGALSEQGFKSMTKASNGNIVVAGTDPTDSWEYGNVYSYDGSTLTKYRESSGLRYVFHDWDILTASDGDLFLAASSHDGSYPGTCTPGYSCYGEIYKSTDHGATWTKQSTLGSYRAYFIEEFNNKLYGISKDDTGVSPRLSESTDDGLTWTTVTPNTTLSLVEPEIHHGDLVFIGSTSGRYALYSMATDGTFTEHQLDFDIAATGYNQMVSVNDYMYILNDSGDVLRSYDLNTWETVAESAATYNIIDYWPNKDWILLAERGPGAKIRYLDLGTLETAGLTNISGFNAIDKNTNRNLAASSRALYSSSRPLRIKNTDGLVVSDIDIDLTTERDWSSVSVGSDATNGKAFVKNLTSAPGAASTHTLYVPIPSGSAAEQFVVCPNAEQMDDVVPTCQDGVWFENGETLTVGNDSVTVTQETIDSQLYWKASGVSGTGGIDTPMDSDAPQALSISVSDSVNQLITWSTQNASSSRVEYGLTSTLGTTTTEQDISYRVTSHSVELTGLQSCTKYYYRAFSTSTGGTVGQSSIQSFISEGC